MYVFYVVLSCFCLWASVACAGSQFKQHRPKRRAGRRAGNRVGVFHALPCCNIFV